jgi:hypothetical protein
MCDVFVQGHLFVDLLDDGRSGRGSFSFGLLSLGIALGAGGSPGLFLKLDAFCPLLFYLSFFLTEFLLDRTILFACGEFLEGMGFFHVV